jgi:hypothetical protein
VRLVLLQITKDSVGPKHICNECYDRVQDWVMFKKQSEDALKEINLFNSDIVEKEVRQLISSSNVSRMVFDF